MTKSLFSFSLAAFLFYCPTSLAQEKIEAISPKQMVMNSFADIVEELLPAVVNISITTNISAAQEFGSGFIISKDGFVVTNNHVIDEASEIMVHLNNGEKYRARIIGIDKKTDLALLKIDAEKDLKFSKFGDSNKSRIGDWVIVIGNPYGLGLSVSTGIISAKGRNLSNGQLDEFIQTDAAINNGNSGGPMFNLKGEIIGISTSIISPTGGSIGIGFAIPSSSATQIVKQLKDQGEVIRGWIGVSVQDVSAEIAETMKAQKGKGAFVTEVAKDGPAEKSGILPTDIIIKIDDQEINEMKILPKTVSKYPVGKIIKVTVLRRGKTKVINVKVARMKDEETAKKSETPRPQERKITSKPAEKILGIGLAELSPEAKKTNNIESNVQGILITDVALKSEAALKGLMQGDIILSVNQIPIDSISDLKEAINNNSKSKKLYLFLKRGVGNYGAALTIK